MGAGACWPRLQGWGRPRCGELLGGGAHQLLVGAGLPQGPPQGRLLGLFCAVTLEVTEPSRSHCLMAGIS